MKEACREVKENPRPLHQHMDEAELANNQRDSPTSPASVAGLANVARASSRGASLCEHATGRTCVVDWVHGFECSWDW